MYREKKRYRQDEQNEVLNLERVLQTLRRDQARLTGAERNLEIRRCSGGGYICDTAPALAQTAVLIGRKVRIAKLAAGWDVRRCKPESDGSKRKTTPQQANKTISWIAETHSRLGGQTGGRRVAKLAAAKREPGRRNPCHRLIVARAFCFCRVRVSKTTGEGIYRPPLKQPCA